MESCRAEAGCGIAELVTHEVNGILADWVQEAYQISVVEGNYYGTGKGSPVSHGGFLTQHSWEHRPKEE